MLLEFICFIERKLFISKFLLLISQFLKSKLFWKELGF